MKATRSKHLILALALLAFFIGHTIAGPIVPVGHINNGGTARSVAVAGNYAFLANEGDGLRIYDISNPANPVNIGHTNSSGGYAWAVAVADHYAYVANLYGGLSIYDVANPTNPVSKSATTDGISARGVAVAGNYA